MESEQNSHSCTFENTHSNIFEMAQGFDHENSKGFVEHSSSSILSNSKNLLQDFERPVSSFQANRGFTKFKGVVGNGELANKKGLDIAGFVGFCSPSIEIKPFDDSDDDGESDVGEHSKIDDGKDDKQQHSSISREPSVSFEPTTTMLQQNPHPLQVRSSLFSGSRNSLNPTMITPKDVEREGFSHSESLPAKVVKPTVLVLGGVNQIAQQRPSVSSTPQTFSGWLNEFYTMMRANSMQRLSNPMTINRQPTAATPVVNTEKKKRGRKKKSEGENHRVVDKSAQKELDREATRDESTDERKALKKEKKKDGVFKQRKTPKKEVVEVEKSVTQILEEAVQSQIELEEPAAKPAAADVDKQKFVENLLCNETDLQGDQVADVEFFSWDGTGTRNPASYFFKVKWKPRPDGTQKPPSIVPWEELKAHAASHPGLINPGIFNEA